MSRSSRGLILRSALVKAFRVDSFHCQLISLTCQRSISARLCSISNSQSEVQQPDSAPNPRPRPDRSIALNRTKGQSAGSSAASSEIRTEPPTPNLVSSRIPSYEFRLLLHTRRRQLLEDLRATSSARDGSAASTGQTSTAQRDLRHLLAIDAALVRVSKGQFGICTACGSEIDRTTLKSDPTFTRCLPCYARAANGQN